VFLVFSSSKVLQLGGATGLLSDIYKIMKKKVESRTEQIRKFYLWIID
jgi:hypothetical protein